MKYQWNPNDLYPNRVIRNDGATHYLRGFLHSKMLVIMDDDNYVVSGDFPMNVDEMASFLTQEGFEPYA